jgi:hypothetical protein
MDKNPRNRKEIEENEEKKIEQHYSTIHKICMKLKMDRSERKPSVTTTLSISHCVSLGRCL